MTLVTLLTTPPWSGASDPEMAMALHPKLRGVLRDCMQQDGWGGDAQGC